MLQDREKTMEELIETRFTPQNFEMYSFEAREPKENRIMYTRTYRERYSFFYSKVFLITLSLDSYMLQDSVDVYPLASVYEVFGEPEAILQSAIGQFIYEYIYPKYGIVFHSDDSRGFYQQVEIFKPTTLRNYKKVLYNDPHFFDPVLEGKKKLPTHHRRYQRPY